MFCHRCGTQIAERAVFCQKCGEKVVYETIDKQPEAVPQVITEEGNTYNRNLQDRNDFKNFVDNHVRSTTKFQSAEALLNRKDPLVYIWILTFIVFVILIGVNVVAEMPELSVGLKLLVVLALGAGIGVVAQEIAGGIIRLRCYCQTSGKFDKSIDIDRLIHFLNIQLNSLYPCFSEWGCREECISGKEGTWTIFHLKAYFGEEAEVTLSIEDRNDIKKYHTGVKVSDGIPIGTPGEAFLPIILFLFTPWHIIQSAWPGNPSLAYKLRIAPIMQAAIEYYLKNVANETK